MATYYILAALSAVGFSAIYFVLNKLIKADEAKKSWILKGFALALALVFALRYLSGEIYLRGTKGLNLNSPFDSIYGKGAPEIIPYTVFSLFAIWSTFASYTLLVTYPFYKDKVRSLTPIVKFFVSVVFLINLATINTQIIAMSGIDVKKGVTLQGVFFAIEVGLSLAICVVTWIKNAKTEIHPKTMGKYLLILLGMYAASIPAYALQVLFDVGPTHIKFDDFNFEHRLVLYGSFIVPAIMILALSKFDYYHKRYALLYISLATMVTFSYGYDFSTFTDMTAWPMHLCNTAMFIIPLCLIFKLNKVFYFTLFINVLGAFFAMAMPNLGDDAYILTGGSIKFWINHYCAFFMPVVIIGVGLYERPKIKQFLYSLLAFVVYYAIVLFMNAWLTNYDSGVDFFFINSDFIADKLGQWALDLRNITVTLHPKEGIEMVLYPLYQSLYFLVYVAMSFGMWFLYELGFQAADLYVDIYHRCKAIKADQLALEVSLAGRNISEPMNMEGTNKLILKDFSKKYATSDVYAVHKANLEIEGGQIFGFLGPNGAGKSTIIKSIVGIQSITSGAIEICGYDVEKQSVGAKLQIGFVPDHYALYENLTGREYVNYIADLYNVSEEDRTARINEYVERFRLQGSFENPIKTYSHGMKQKITIMSALVHNPKLWILDEPLTGLDPESIFQVKEAMKKHAQEGNIVFFSSHIIDVVERICDRIAIIKKGNILVERSVKELEEQGIQLESYYMDMIENTPVTSVPVEKTATAEEATK
ncbi:MAG: ATP-binding cassette domain-containing protein [Clostridiales bacterium]|nr:ATP-binding cassette domain-containing protein [Clostridiales bacterium]